MVMVVQLCEYTKNHRIVHLNRMNFIVRELYLNIPLLKKKKKGRQESFLRQSCPRHGAVSEQAKQGRNLR